MEEVVMRMEVEVVVEMEVEEMTLEAEVSRTRRAELPQRDE